MQILELHNVVAFRVAGATTISSGPIEILFAAEALRDSMNGGTVVPASPRAVPKAAKAKQKATKKRPAAKRVPKLIKKSAPKK